jgi:hypothetical protein
MTRGLHATSNQKEVSGRTALETGVVSNNISLIGNQVVGSVRHNGEFDMRVMEIPPFPQTIEICDFNYFLRTRLTQTTVMWPNQAIPLLGYMCYPNDQEKRQALMQTLRSWAMETEGGHITIPRRLRRIQHEWLRVADIVHLHFDLTAGQHQLRRGGPSIGKAIGLAEANTKSRGTSASSLWEHWSTYKDVAPLVAAATLICAEARTRYQQQPFGPYGLSHDQLIPFQMAMLMPDFVLAAALEFERSTVPDGYTEPVLDPQTLWRIPMDISVVSLEPPSRKIRPQDLRILNDRRAGNRGRANRQTASAVPS